MRFMLMMHAPRGTGDYQIGSWSPDDLKAHIAFMHSFNKELRDAGELVGAEGLAAPGEAKIVRAGKNGVPAVTDGPFAEAKEIIGGYWFFLAGSLDEAAALAAQNPCMACGLSYEVRPIETERASAYKLSNETPGRAGNP